MTQQALELAIYQIKDQMTDVKRLFMQLNREESTAILTALDSKPKVDWKKLELDFYNDCIDMEIDNVFHWVKQAIENQVKGE